MMIETDKKAKPFAKYFASKKDAREFIHKLKEQPLNISFQNPDDEQYLQTGKLIDDQRIIKVNIDSWDKFNSFLKSYGYLASVRRFIVEFIPISH